VDVDNKLKATIKTDSVNERWLQFREAVTNSAEVNIGYINSRKTRKPWVTQEMLDKMEERRKWKRQNTTQAKKQYTKLNSELRRITDKARQQWWQAQCDELDRGFAERMKARPSIQEGKISNREKKEFSLSSNYQGQELKAATKTK
jgi:hypothetical protein